LAGHHEFEHSVSHSFARSKDTWNRVA
jgi:hypothetical protein